MYKVNVNYKGTNYTDLCGSADVIDYIIEAIIEEIIIDFELEDTHDNIRNACVIEVKKE